MLMLIETVADQRLAQAVETIADALSRECNKRQYVKAIRLNHDTCEKVEAVVSAINKAGGTVERIDSNDNDIYILYRADEPIGLR